MKKLSNVLLVLVSFFGYSQSYKGVITDVKESGLHAITLAPEVRAAAQNDLRFLRILDGKSNQVPYVIDMRQNQSEKYQSFAILSKEQLQDSITSLVIQNEKRKQISQFSLQIENTSLTKSYSISGSNDGKQWFGLVQNQALSSLIAAKGTSVSRSIDFPANNYPFLRIVFNDRKSLPLNIIAVGIAETQLIPEQFVEVTAFTYKIEEDKVKKLTKIHFTANQSFEVDALSFTIKSDYFDRRASLTATRTEKVKKRSRTYQESLAQFNLNSKKDRSIYFNAINEREFTVEIENQDNQPLLIDAIRVLQKPIVVLSKLTEQEKYEVIIDTTLSVPAYDLNNFIAEESGVLPKAKIANFTKLESKKTAPLEKSFWQTNLFMWLCIVVGGGIVGYFAFGLIKDMNA
ncbi:hypothetical protein [Flavobacterium sp. SM2513]|uniref:hypothetical protein n=1 Tax=Flavobacterium sp. SM2513 TaxID=3424766 RepID=UPI003D7FA2B2